MQNTYDSLAQLLSEIPEYTIEGILNKNLIAELARNYDADLLNRLLSNEITKKMFFTQSTAGPIFKRDIFLQFILQKEFLPDSYTAYKSRIGLATDINNYISEDSRVVLNWPYKECILEGGQDKEDQKRDEVFFNEILAPDQINTLLDDKVFTNWKRYDKDGEHELDKLKPDDNLIIKGNNLIVLHSLKKRFAGKVKLIYIDVPFNTKNDSFGYNDTFNHSTWLTFMKNRLEIAKQLLSDDGTIFIHADWHETHYEKVLLDEIFGRNNLINEIIWCYTGPGSPKMKQLNRKHDTIFWYSKNTGRYTFNKDDIRVPYADPNQSFRKAFDGAGEGWTEEDLKELRERGRVPDDWWDDIAIAARLRIDGVKRTGYLTEKPPKLMDRIIRMASNEKDIVLDFFAGSGTTLYSAANLGRQYIGIEQLSDTQGIMLKRMSAVSNFVYCNIKNDANIFREKVRDADEKKLEKLLEEVLKSSFLSYRVDPKKVSKKEFEKLSMADKKRILIDLVDNNTLYLNYSEINDKTYSVSEADKKHNKEFYGE